MGNQCNADGVAEVPLSWYVLKDQKLQPVDAPHNVQTFVHQSDSPVHSDCQSVLTKHYSSNVFGKGFSYVFLLTVHIEGGLDAHVVYAAEPKLVENDFRLTPSRVQERVADMLKRVSCSITDRKSTREQQRTRHHHPYTEAVSAEPKFGAPWRLREAVSLQNPETKAEENIWTALQMELGQRIHSAGMNPITRESTAQELDEWRGMLQELHRKWEPQSKAVWEQLVAYVKANYGIPNDLLTPRRSAWVF